MNIKVFRYDPLVDSYPRYETYKLPMVENKVIVDYLERLRLDLGVSGLAYRWFCGVKKCGVCGMNANRRPVLGCWELVRTDLLLEPLPNFPIIKDLVVDISEYENIVLGVNPFVVRDKPVRKFPEKISHKMMEKVHVLQGCFECYLCTSAVPIKSLTPAKKIVYMGVGPAALTKLAKVALDPRDAYDRREVVQTSGVENYLDYDELATVCPMGINIREHVIKPLITKYNLTAGNADKVLSELIFVRSPEMAAFVNIHSNEKRRLVAEGILRFDRMLEDVEIYKLA
ncbi:MAG: 2Fe-2S iron-sulfur cluster-binding protein [Candidatus Caldarchaeum sp.]